MRVLMQIRPDYESKSGGDSVQLLQTKRCLESLGVAVDISTELEPDLRGYDLVHLFNLTRVQESCFQARNAMKQDKPIVLSTIYWPFDEFASAGGHGIVGFLGKHLSTDSFERLKAVAKYFVRGERSRASRYLITHSFTDMQRETVELSDLCLPNSETEMRRLIESLRCHERPYVVVPNAVDLDAAAEASSMDKDEAIEYDLVCVGRIEPRKNQLALLKAIAGTSLTLALIGKCAPGQRNYFEAVRRESSLNPNVRYIESIPNREIYKLYRKCRVSVQPSWFETPGLASLEAAAMGCAVVVSTGGTTRDYFGNDAFYCDASNSASISSAIKSAISTGPSKKLEDRVKSDFTWTRAAEKTLLGYEKAIDLHYGIGNSRISANMTEY